MALVTWWFTQGCRRDQIGWGWQLLQDPEDKDAAGTWQLVPSAIPAPRRQDGWGELVQGMVLSGHARLLRESTLSTPGARDLAAVSPAISWKPSSRCSSKPL